MPHADREARLAYLRDYRADHADHTKAERQRRKRQKLREILCRAKSVPCADCGRNDLPPHAMDFDHVHGKKEFELHRAIRTNKGLAVVLAEIAKCEVVCAVCHRLRHPPEV